MEVQRRTGPCRHQPARGDIHRLLHCLSGDVLYVLEETTISYETDYNTCLSGRDDARLTIALLGP